MGYRSEVRALIYGEPETVCQLVAAHVLQGGVNVLQAFGDSLTRYRVQRRTYDGEATCAQERDADGRQTPIFTTREVEVLDLYGDSWKWYEDYKEVRAWTEFQHAAVELGLSYEFVRVGEETEDVETISDVQDDGDCYLQVARSIVDDIPEERTPVDYSQPEAA